MIDITDEQHESIVRTARIAVQALLGLLAAAAVLLPELAAFAAAHADTPAWAAIGAYAVQALGGIAVVTALWNKLETNYPRFRALLPAWLRRDIAEITDGELGDAE